MEDIASALGLIKAIVWGESAMGFVGVGTIRNCFMFVIEDSDLGVAIESLHGAGFRDASWSYGSIVNLEVYKDEKMQNIHRRTAINYRYIDANSIRFEFPADSEEELRVVLVRSSYTHLSLQPIPNLAKTVVREPEPSRWSSTLEFWGITYLYGQLMLDDDVLDSSSDEKAKTWFNENIRRYSGGLDRSMTKRRGREAPTTQLQD
ncbi:hypothetical protein F4782DRAFT_550302 [Xylaria castorea]|nr:hypothetical protein F4782DRAFT_550302 [Xylaria castorea]